MFARTLDKPQVSFVERVDDDQHVERVDPEFIGSDEVMQSYRTLKRAVKQGRKASEALCRQIARRVARHEGGKRDIALRIVRARFDPVAYFVSNAPPEDREVIASCNASARP
jgi:hypothetical protein